MVSRVALFIMPKTQTTSPDSFDRRWLGLLCGTLAMPACGASAKVVQAHSEVLRVQADEVVGPSGKPVSLRGVQFANWVYSNAVDLDPANTYADERDYQRAAAMG